MHRWLTQQRETIWGQINESRATGGKRSIGYSEHYTTFDRIFDDMIEANGNLALMDAQTFNRFIRPRMTTFKYEKSAEYNLRDIDLNGFASFDRYVKSATEHIHIGPRIAELRELMKPFRNKKGEMVYNMKESQPNLYKYADEWLNFTSGIRPRSTETTRWIDKSLDRLSRNLSWSVLSANLRSATIQPSALVTTHAKVGTKTLMQGVYDAMDPGKWKWSKTVNSGLTSRQFEIAVTHALQAMRKEATRGGRARQWTQLRARDIDKAFTYLASKGFKPLQILDMFAAEASFHAGYRHALKRGLTEKQAIDFGRDLVTKTQASAVRSDLAPIQRTALGRAATLFQTFVINHWNFLNREVLGRQNVNVSQKQALINTMRYVVGSTLVSELYEGILGMQSPFPTPVRAFVEEYKKTGNAAKAVAKTVREAAEVIPLVGGGIRFGTSPLGAVVQLAEEIPGTLGGARGFKPYWWEVGGKVFGVPGTSQFAKFIRRQEKKTKKYKMP